MTVGLRRERFWFLTAGKDRNDSARTSGAILAGKAWNVLEGTVGVSGGMIWQARREEFGSVMVRLGPSIQGRSGWSGSDLESWVPYWHCRRVESMPVLAGNGESCGGKAGS
jgi:hypothetical protein